jgi:hypothetical protein
MRWCESSSSLAAASGSPHRLPLLDVTSSSTSRPPDPKHRLLFELLPLARVDAVLTSPASAATDPGLFAHVRDAVDVSPVSSQGRFLLQLSISMFVAKSGEQSPRFCGEI